MNVNTDTDYCIFFPQRMLIDKERLLLLTENLIPNIKTQVAFFLFTRIGGFQIEDGDSLHFTSLIGQMQFSVYPRKLSPGF